VGGSSSEPLPNWRWVIGQIRNTREHVAEPGEGIDRVTKTAAVLPHRSLPKRSVGATHGEAAERSFGRVDRKKHSGRIIIGASGVRVIRERTSLSQSEFAHLIGVSVKTLQNWEQDRRRPTGPAAALLSIIKYDPALAVKAIHRA